MLDVFGSVFGRSKKESKSAQNGGQQQPQQPSPSTSRRDGSGSEGEADGFTVLNPQSSSSNVMYPMILTDEMLRSPPSTTNPVVATGTTNNTTTNPSTSASTAMNNHDSVPSHDRFNSLSTPMDNVPFAPNAFFSSGNGSRGTDNLGRCISTIDRVGHFITSADYNFSLERGVLRD